MPLVSLKTPSFTGGVSQQPRSIRFPQQLELQENAFPSIVDGLTKRHPTQHVGKLVDGNAGDLKLHTIDRDDSEQYQVIISNKKLRVFALDGREVPVRAGQATASLPTFDYLDTTRQNGNALLSPDDLDVTGGDWVKNASAGNPQATSTVGPLGYDTAVDLITLVGGGGNGRWTQTWGVFGPAGTKSSFSIHVKPESGANALVNIGFRDTTNGLDHVGTFDFNTGVNSVPSYMDVQQDDLPLGWKRIRVTVDTATAPTTAGGDARDVVVEVPFQAVTPRVMTAWGAYGRDDVRSLTHPYALDARGFKALTIADFTFVTNTYEPTAMTTATRASLSTFGQGYVWVRQGAYDKEYSVTVHTSATGAPGTKVTTTTWDGKGGAGSGPGAGEVEIDTDKIAEDLRVKIDSLTGLTATRVGSVVRVVGSVTGSLLALKEEDGLSNTALVAAQFDVRSFDDLPDAAQDDFRLKVLGNVQNDEDDYWLRFVADVDGDFSRGHWVEWMAPDLTYEIDGDTMPHQLVRVQDDSVGTYTGLPNQVFFAFEPVDWTDRFVGDDTTAPLPSFIGNTVSDFFFHENRLGILSKESVILSESGRFFNWFRTTVRALPDSDPIDVATSSVDVAPLRYALPFNERLVLWSDEKQFVLEGDPFLAPRTAGSRPISDYEVAPDVRPIPSERSMFFGYRSGPGYSGVRELFQVDDETFDDLDVSATVPAYIEGNGLKLAVSAAEEMLVFLADGDPTKLYVHKSFDAGNRRLQTAWSTYTFGSDALIRGVDWVDSTLYLTVQRTQGLFLEKMEVGSNITDTDTEYVVTLDRRFTDDGFDLSPSFNGSRTTWTLPYDVTSADLLNMVVVTRNKNADVGGTVLPIVGANLGTPGAHTIQVTGDYEDHAVWIGFKYEMRAQLSTLYLREETGESGVSAILDGTLQLIRGKLLYEDSRYFQVSVKAGNRTAQVRSFGSDTSGLDGSLASGTLEFSILSDNEDAVLELLNDSPFPSTFVSAEWTANYTPKATRLTG